MKAVVQEGYGAPERVLSWKTSTDSASPATSALHAEERDHRAAALLKGVT